MSNSLQKGQKRSDTTKQSLPISVAAILGSLVEFPTKTRQNIVSHVYACPSWEPRILSQADKLARNARKETDHLSRSAARFNVPDLSDKRGPWGGRGFGEGDLLLDNMGVCLVEPLFGWFEKKFRTKSSIFTNPPQF